MFSSPFFRRLFLPYLLLICAAVAAVGFFGGQRLRQSYLDTRRQSLHEQLLLIEDLLGHQLRESPTDINARVRELGDDIGSRITLIDAQGKVLADSMADPATMENHATRPEFAQAMSGVEGMSVRTSDTIHERMLALAHRIDAGDGKVYYVRVAALLRNLDRELRVLYGGLAAVAALAMVIAGIISYFFARHHSAPLVELTHFAESLAQGDLRRRALTGLNKGEIATVAGALNSMADNVHRLLSEAAKDKAELLAILASMSEGVVATDTQQRILLVNEAAANLLGFKQEHSAAKLLWEIIRNEEILKSATQVLSNGREVTFDIGPIGGRFLEITVCPFPTRGTIDGLVIVAHDITQSVRYQELRKEFVANVSHELRTPLSVIKGFVETLIGGAMHDPVKGPEYLATIEKHADQLNNLVNDLLEISRLESDPTLLRRTNVDVRDNVRKAVDLLQPAAIKKNQTVQVQADPSLPSISANPDYIERAVANLVENAIKYTPDGGRITVRTTSDNGHVVVEVADNGIGIPRDDLPRIFERFYRVDRSRSRQMGGTGLGLSIVKHIVQAHGGSIDVASTPGAGSSFRLSFPRIAGRAEAE